MSSSDEGEIVENGVDDLKKPEQTVICRPRLRQRVQIQRLLAPKPFATRFQTIP
jgi:hypothetical protein